MTLIDFTTNVIQIFRVCNTFVYSHGDRVSKVDLIRDKLRK